MRYRWILFDADGVLFDYDAAERDALTAAWSLTGRPMPGDLIDVYHGINEGLWRDYENGRLAQDRLRVLRFELLLQAQAVDCDAVAVSDRFVAGLSASGALLPGVDGLLRALHGRVGIGMVTNGIAEVQRSRIARSGIGPFLASVSISGEVGAAKPDPRIFDHAFAQMGGPAKSDVLMVGDSLTSDILGGVRYGIDTCWVNAERRAVGDGPAPKFVVASAAELVSLL